MLEPISASLVDAAGRQQLIIIGFMTHMCVTFTAEGAFLRGNQPTIVADACATRPLRSAVADVEAKQLHHCALATIADLYGVVVPRGRAALKFGRFGKLRWTASTDLGPRD